MSAGAPARRSTTRSSGDWTRWSISPARCGRNRFRFVEPNLSGIGGLHMVPTSERLVSELVVPALRQARTRRSTSRRTRHPGAADPGDPGSYAKPSGPGRQLCLIEPKYAGDGPDEQEQLCPLPARAARAHVMHADPAELSCSRARSVTTATTGWISAYRDYSVTDLLELEEEGVRRRADEAAAAGEPDDLLHRRRAGPEELLGSAHRPADLPRSTSARTERPCFSGMFSWTRLSPTGGPCSPRAAGELLEYVRPAPGAPGAQAQPLLRRRRGDAGPRGVACTNGTRRHRGGAGRQPERWVVQQLATIPVREFPVLRPDGRRAAPSRSTRSWDSRRPSTAWRFWPGRHRSRWSTWPSGAGLPPCW